LLALAEPQRRADVDEPGDPLGVLGRQGPPGLPAWLAWLTAPVAVAFVAVGGLAWRAGIRHYVGTGS